MKRKRLTQVFPFLLPIRKVLFRNADMFIINRQKSFVKKHLLHHSLIDKSLPPYYNQSK